jgi:hypothetical protein
VPGQTQNGIVVTNVDQIMPSWYQKERIKIIVEVDEQI